MPSSRNCWISTITVSRVDDAASTGRGALGRLNIRGRMIDLLTYDGTYVDEQDGKIKPYIPAKQICVTTPGAGRRMAQVSQIEQTIAKSRTYMGHRVPRYWTEKNARELSISPAARCQPVHPRNCSGGIKPSAEYAVIGEKGKSAQQKLRKK